MRRRLTDRDIEALLDPSNPVNDHSGLSALVSELRRAYVATPDLPPGDELAEAMHPVEGIGWSTGIAEPRQRSSRSRKALAGLTTLVATTAGKVLVGTALAASAVGGVHATDLVDVPALPLNDPTTTAVPPAGSGPEGGRTTDTEPGAVAAEPGDMLDGDRDQGLEGRDETGAHGGGDHTGDDLDGDRDDRCQEPESDQDQADHGDRSDEDDGCGSGRGRGQGKHGDGADRHDDEGGGGKGDGGGKHDDSGGDRKGKH